MRKIPFLGLLALLLLVVFVIGGCGGANALGVVDVNKVMTDSPQVKQMQDQLNAKGKALSDQLEKDKPTISQDEFQKRQETAYNDFMKTKQDLEGQIDASMKQALADVAKEKKLGVVLYKNSVAQGGTDITDAVIQKMQ